MRGLAGRPVETGAAAQQPQSAENRLAMLVKTLGLTETQVSSIRNAIQAQQQTMQALLQEVQDKKQALDAAAGQASPDAAAVGNAFLALRASEAKARDARKQLHTSIQNILTPEQQRIVTAVKTMMQGMRGARGRGTVRMELFGMDGLLDYPDELH